MGCSANIDEYWSYSPAEINKVCLPLIAVFVPFSNILTASYVVIEFCLFFQVADLLYIFRLVLIFCSAFVWTGHCSSHLVFKGNYCVASN